MVLWTAELRRLIKPKLPKCDKGLDILEHWFPVCPTLPETRLFVKLQLFVSTGTICLKRARTLVVWLDLFGARVCTSCSCLAVLQNVIC